MPEEPELPAARKFKKPRAARACELCRAKKYRCDEQDPCGRCRRRNITCIYQDARRIRERLRSNAHEDTNAASERTPSVEGFGVPISVPVQQRTTPTDYPPSQNQEGEVSEVNPHTLNNEFHGPTSSLAFLAALQQRPPNRLQGVDGAQRANAGTQSLVSAFHNDSFSPDSVSNGEQALLSQVRYHFRQSQFFLDGYFQNLHFIHPIIDRSEFRSRCEDLWFGQLEKQPRSFVALYYAIMSLGALTSEWDEDSLDGLGRFEWSRKMFQHASVAMGNFLLRNDLETVQASMIMSKVCQNELNPHLAYMYLGQAVRTSLSAGHNRQSQRDRGRLSATRPSGKSSATSKTWWGLYSLEIEMSFALGRPDSLGLDVYHNQIMPQIDDSETAILPTMVELARLVRKVSVSVYLSAISVAERIETAKGIESEMDGWILSLPQMLQPRLGDRRDPTEPAGIVKDPTWAKKQRHTLTFRCYNIKMVLFRPFLLYAAHNPGVHDEELDGVVAKCVSAALSTIQLMHQMYCNASYFRTWWYNTTYTLYAASIILSYLTKLAPIHEKTGLLRLIDMSVEVLNTMDENVVAKRAAVLLRQATTQVRDGDTLTTEATTRPSQQEGSDPCLGAPIQVSQVHLDATDEADLQGFIMDPFNDADLDFMAQLFPMNDIDFTPQDI